MNPKQPLLVKIPCVLLVMLFLTLSVRESAAASYYWIRTTAGNWNNAANWSATSGGIGGAGIPALNDLAFFDGNGNGACSVIANLNIGGTGGITLNSTYTGTLSVAAGITLTTGTGHFTQYGGIFNAGTSGTITIGGRFRMYGGTFTATSGILNLQGDSVIFAGGTFNHSNGTVRFNGMSSAGNVYISGSQNMYNIIFHGSFSPTYYFILTGTTLNAASNLTFTDNGATGVSGLRTGTVAVQGNIFLSSLNGTYGDATILINGTGNQTIFGMAANNVPGLPAVNIQKVSGTLTLQNFITVNASWTYTSGTLAIGTSTVTFHRGLYPITITGNHTLYNVTFRSVSGTTYTVAAATTFTVSGTLSYIGTMAITINTGNILARGDFLLNNTATTGGGTATITLSGTVNQNLNSSVPALQSKLCNIVIAKPSGTLFLIGTISSVANWTYTSGTLTAGFSTVVFCGNATTLIQTIAGSHSLYNVDISPQTASAISYNIGAATVLTVQGLLSISGIIGYSINTGTIDARSDITVTNTITATGGSGLIHINGTVNQTLSGSGTIGGGRLPRVSIDKVTGTLTIPAAILSVANNWTYVQGLVNATASSIYFYGASIVTGAAGLGFMSFNHVFIYGNISLGSNIDINGNFTINTACFLDVSVSNYSINLAGNWINNNSANLSSFNQRNGSVFFDGGTVAGQLVLFSTAHIETFYIVEINRPSGFLILNASIQIANNMNFVSGFVTELSGANVIFQNTSTATGASNLSYVEGQSRKIGTQAFAFPIGKSGWYRPISISAPAVITDYYNAEYFRTQAPLPMNIALHDPTIQLISQCEYWILNQSVGASNVVVTLSWNAASTPSCTVLQPADLVVTHWNGSLFVNDGNSGTTGTLANGTVSGLGPNTGYGGFTLASTTFANPLPIEIIDFNATPQDQQVILDWSTGSETNNDYFTIEKTKDGITFETVGIIDGAGNSTTIRNYQTKDEHPYDGTSYYRLKQTDFNGQFSYSEFKEIQFVKEETNEVLSIYPNPGNGIVSIVCPGDPEEIVSMLITDMSGRVLLEKQLSIAELLHESLELPQGIYSICINHGVNRLTSQLVIL